MAKNCIKVFLEIKRRYITGGFNPAMASHPVYQWDLTPSVKDLYHTKMAQILVSVYSVFRQPHSTSE